ncbi:MAG: site-specific integrase [Bacteroidales bacterium]|nr:site-specific integrase [Bacteroidales bacterium]
MKIIKGLNTLSLDDIIVMTGFNEDEITEVLDKLISNGVIDKFLENEYRYVNKIPERKGTIRLVEKPQKQIIKDKNILFIDAAEYFITHHAMENCSPSSLQTYISITKAHLIPFFGKIKIKNITQNKIKEFIELKQKENLSTRRIRNCVTLFGNMFNKFKEWEFISDSPYSGIINVKFTRENNIRVLSKTEVNFLLKKSKTKYPKLYQIILLALLTGMKRAEILALTIEDIDLKNRKININKTIFEGEILIPRFKATFRQVDIPENLVPKLKKIIEKKKHDDFIFYDKSVSWFTQDKYIRINFTKFIKDLGLERITFNELRHTYAYRILQDGMSIDYLHKQLGDYSIQATMDKYRDFIN